MRGAFSRGKFKDLRYLVFSSNEEVYLNNLITYVLFYFLECGGYYTSLSGNVTSPGFPNNYPNNANCYYEISVPADRRIVFELQFHDLEYRYDRLQIRQMVSRSNNLVIELTATNNNLRRIISAENILMLVFTSDANRSKRGFSANYYTIKSGIRT